MKVRCPEGLKNYLMKKKGKKEDKKEDMKKEGADLFDIVKSKLIDEGVDEKEALKIMINLSEDELNKISEGLAVVWHSKLVWQLVVVFFLKKVLIKQKNHLIII